MDDLRFDSSIDFWKYRMKMKKISKGSQGTVYHDGSNVVKKFSPLTCLELDIYKWLEWRFDVETQDFSKWMLEFRDTDIPGFYFPKAGVYIREKLKGCITEYAEGHSLEEIELYSVKINTLLQAITELEEAVRLASKEKIFIWDVHEGNVLFDGRRFSMIDTLSYQRRNEVSESGLLKHNNIEVFRCIVPSMMPSSISLFTRNTKKAYEDPLESLKRYIDLLERTLKTSVETFQDAEDLIEEKHIRLDKAKL